LHKRINISEGDYRKGKGKTGLLTLKGALSFWDNNSPMQTLQDKVTSYTKQHCDKYRQDTEYFSELLDMKNNAKTE